MPLRGAQVGWSAHILRGQGTLALRRSGLIALVLGVLILSAWDDAAGASGRRGAPQNRPRITARLDGLAQGTPMLMLSVGWPSARIQSATLGLPKGLSFNPRKISRRMLKAGRLIEQFFKPGVTDFIVEVLPGQLREGRVLQRQVNSGKVHALTLKLWLTNGRSQTRLEQIRIRQHRSGWSS